MGKLKPRQASRPSGDGQLFKALGALVGAAMVALCIFFVFIAGDVATDPPRAASVVPMQPRAAPEQKATERRAPTRKRLARHDTGEWRALTRSLSECLASQDELMTTPAVWPGFHALCIDALSDDHISLAVHNRSGAPSRSTVSGTRRLSARTALTGGSPSALVDALIASLRAELEAYEFAKVDPLISTSEYDFPPNPWKLFTPMGAPVQFDADLAALGVEHVDMLMLRESPDCAVVQAMWAEMEKAKAEGRARSLGVVDHCDPTPTLTPTPTPTPADPY